MPAERRRCFGGYSYPRQLTHEQYHDPSRHKLVVSFSQVDLAFRFFYSLFFMFAQKCNIIPQCCKDKHQFNEWNKLSPELLELMGIRTLFMAQFIFLNLVA